MFVLNTKETITYVLVYVDDIIVTRSNPAHIEKLIKDLGAPFALKDMGDLSFFLGIEVLRHGNELVLTQRKYITDQSCRMPRDIEAPYNGINNLCFF